MSARGMWAMVHEPEFQVIQDWNSQLFFFTKSSPDECPVSMNNKKLAEIYQISEGHVRQLRCVAKQKQETASRPVGRPYKLTVDPEKKSISKIYLTIVTVTHSPTHSGSHNLHTRLSAQVGGRTFLNSTLSAKFAFCFWSM
jgi:hypothetical protein